MLAELIHVRRAVDIGLTQQEKKNRRGTVMMTDRCWLVFFCASFTLAVCAVSCLPTGWLVGVSQLRLREALLFFFILFLVSGDIVLLVIKKTNKRK